MNALRAGTRRLVMAALIAWTFGAIAAEALEAASSGVVEIRLSDGTLLVGRVSSEDADTLVLQSESLGRLVIARAEVLSVVPRESSLTLPGEVPDAEPAAPVPAPPPESRYRLDPDRNSVLLGPTPETLPAGSAYFRNFELIVLNVGFAPSDWLNFSVGSLFPISSELVSMSGGFKARILSREERGIGLAVAASGTALEDERFGSIAVIAGIGNPRRSLNLSVHRTFAEGEGVTFFILGGDLQTGRSFKLLAEYANSTDALLKDDDFDGFLNVGFRVLGTDSSFSLTGFRPLEDTGDSFLAFPLAMYSRHF